MDADTKTILLKSAEEGNPAKFDGIGGLVHDRVRQEMRRIYTSDDVPAFLDANAQSLLAEGRARFAFYRLDRQPLVPYGEDTILFCWRGDQILHILAAQLRLSGLGTPEQDVEEEGHALVVPNIQPSQLADVLRQLAAQEPADVGDLLPFCGELKTEKHDDYVPSALLGAHYAARYLDAPGAWNALNDMLALL